MTGLLLKDKDREYLDNLNSGGVHGSAPGRALLIRLNARQQEPVWSRIGLALTGQPGEPPGAHKEEHMLKQKISSEDQSFRRAFEACECPASDFDHRAHVRLAYVYLCEYAPDQAHKSMKHSLLRFLRHLGIGESKYHETLTRSWVMAVNHFMNLSPECHSANDFIDQNPVLLDTKIMLSHYSAEVLFSPAARTQFVEPDIQEIPHH